MQLQLNVELGTRRPMHCTGLGKAILAFLPQAQQDQVLAAAPLRAYTPHTITDPIVLRLELKRAGEHVSRRLGYNPRGATSAATPSAPDGHEPPTAPHEPSRAHITP